MTMTSVVKKRPSREQLEKISRLAAKKIRLAETQQHWIANNTAEGLDLVRGIEKSIARLETEILGSGVDPEDFEVVMVEYCRIAALLRIETLLKVQCRDCTVKENCSDTQNAPTLCVNFIAQWNAHNYDEFGRDKRSLVVTRLLIQKFL